MSSHDNGDGERLIESFMLAANETVAEHFSNLDVPFIYRTRTAKIRKTKTVLTL